MNEKMENVKTLKARGFKLVWKAKRTQANLKKAARLRKEQTMEKEEKEKIVLGVSMANKEKARAWFLLGYEKGINCLQVHPSLLRGAKEFEGLWRNLMKLKEKEEGGT